MVPVAVVAAMLPLATTLGSPGVSAAALPGAAVLGPALAVGGDHTCVVQLDATVACWGAGANGELGSSDRPDSRPEPAPVAGLVRVTGVDAGDDGTCAVTAFGTIACWGDGGLVGRPGQPVVAPTPVPGIVGAVQVSVGGGDACARSAGGTVTCWGRSYSSPVEFSWSGMTAADVSTGDGFACAVLDTGGIVCWGRNPHGQLGNGTTTDSPAPTAVAAVTDAADVEVGDTHACARRIAGQVVCWGYNGVGALGDGTKLNSTTPVAVTGVADAVDLGVGQSHTCAVRSDTTVWCWGSGLSGQLADGFTTMARTAPAPVPGLADVTELSVGAATSCVRHVDRSVTCWGADDAGQLGTGIVSGTPQGPVVADATDLDAGRAHTCAVRSDETVACWGDNGAGQLGDTTTASRLFPTQVIGLGQMADVAVGGRHTCGVGVDGDVFCWGADDHGQRGRGTAADAPVTATVVGGLTATAAAVVAGDDHTCALVIDGTVSCWGANSLGAVGAPDAGDVRSPTAVAGVSGVTALAAHGATSCAIHTTGAVTCWGEGIGETLGQPVVLPSVTNASGVAIGRGGCGAADQVTVWIRASSSLVSCWTSGQPSPSAIIA
ncbi:MAG: hypothetical protein KDB21_09080, partial [Acidimicrobiales bacterium]|nr:hypothetical protein [Acidimicrobiales bacterium]